jgi:hypothetical protein
VTTPALRVRISPEIQSRDASVPGREGGQCRIRARRAVGRRERKSDARESDRYKTGVDVGGLPPVVQVVLCRPSTVPARRGRPWTASSTSHIARRCTRRRPGQMRRGRLHRSSNSSSSSRASTTATGPARIQGTATQTCMELHFSNSSRSSIHTRQHTRMQQVR